MRRGSGCDQGHHPQPWASASATDRPSAAAAHNAVGRLERSSAELFAREARLAEEIAGLSAVQGQAAGQHVVLREAVGAAVQQAQALQDALRLERARYDVERVDLKKWFSDDQLARARAAQEGYAKWMADRGI